MPTKKKSTKSAAKKVVAKKPAAKKAAVAKKPAAKQAAAKKGTALPGTKLADLFGAVKAQTKKLVDASKKKADAAKKVLATAQKNLKTANDALQKARKNAHVGAGQQPKASAAKQLKAAEAKAKTVQQQCDKVHADWTGAQATLKDCQDHSRRLTGAEKAACDSARDFDAQLKSAAVAKKEAATKAAATKAAAKPAKTVAKNNAKPKANKGKAAAGLPLSDSAFAHLNDDDAWEKFEPSSNARALAKSNNTSDSDAAHEDDWRTVESN